MPAKEVIRRLSRIDRSKKQTGPGKMTPSELLIANRRLEALVESGLMLRKEKAAWDRRIDDGKASLAEVEQYAAKKRNWPSKKT
jgi:hypothetical protein